jgi:Holliday junction resolvasome RuvABC DNA-binding subunit
MIGRINGTLISMRGGRGIIRPEDSGIGYVVIMPLNQTYEDQTSVGVWIWHAFSQDDQKLYGFDTADERWLAELVATTHRVGPGLAHKAVTTLGYGAIVAMIKKGDEAGLAKAVKGLGAKSASAIIANLQGRLGEVVATQDHRIRQVQNGLRAIGIELDDALADLIIHVAKQHPEVDASGILNAVLAQRRA